MLINLFILLNTIFILTYALYNLYLIKLIEIEKYDIWHFHSLNYKTLLLIKCLKE